MWKSRWFANRDYADLLHEDVELRRQLKDRLRSAGVSSIDIERAANKLVIRIYTARPDHHWAQGSGDRQAEERSAEAHPPRGAHRYPGSPPAGARRATGGRIDCSATRKARGLPPRDAQGGGLSAALRLQGNQGARRGPAERRGNRAQGVVPARAAAAADASRRHRFRFRPGLHHLRRDRRQMLDLSRRKDSRPRPGGYETARARRRVNNHVDAEKSEISQAAAGPAPPQGLARGRALLRRIRAEGIGARLDH